MEFKCRKCNKIFPETNFYKSSKPLFYDKICKSCKQERIKEQRKNQKLWCVKYKGEKCIICGYNKCIRSLDFHHLDPEKKNFICHIKQQQKKN